MAVLIYGLYYKNTQSLIYNNLKEAAEISALFYLEEDELNETEFEKIRMQFLEILSDVDIQVYNVDNELVHDEPDTISAGILDKIRSSRQYSFSVDKYLCYGIFYEDNQGDFVIIAKEKQAVLAGQTHLLLVILIICFFVGIVAIVLFSRWVAKMAYRWMANVSETMVIQRNFVNYVSHEFKTPLASILGNLEVFSIKDRSPEEYRQLSEKLIRQVGQMEEILDTLLVVSDLKKETGTGEQTRLDELIWEIINKITERHPHADIRVELNILPEDEHLLAVSTERTQLLLMLFNLVENAVKYSQGKTVVINIFARERRLWMSIADKGIGILPEDLAHISKPFYRADHTNRIEGSGIGLSIALRIMERNGIVYEIKSEVNTGTTVTLTWKT
jgi:signal transduction histidine kinase